MSYSAFALRTRLTSTCSRSSRLSRTDRNSSVVACCLSLPKRYDGDRQALIVDWPEATEIEWDVGPPSPMCSKADRPQREPAVDWCRTSGNHEYCANPMDPLRYQRSSGVAEPPGRQAAAVRRSLEPDGCLARSVAAMKRRNGCDWLLHSVSRIGIGRSSGRGDCLLA